MPWDLLSLLGILLVLLLVLGGCCLLYTSDAADEQ